MITSVNIPHHLQAIKEVRRETFAALMDVYENNFLRIKKLIPGLDLPEGDYVSSVIGCLDLRLSVLEKSKYTSLLQLTYWFERESKKVPEPNLVLRVYHDVGLIEVLSGELHHGRLILNNLPETAIDDRWQLNRFLYKWLGFCLHIGHCFDGQDQSQQLNRRINRILAAKI